MARLAYLAFALLTIGPAAAGARAAALPATPYYAMPAYPTQQTGSPVQQQIIENYRTQLLQAQRAARQNGSALDRRQLDIERRLNAANSAPNPTPLPARPAAPSLDVVPAPPFNAAPR